MSRRPIVSLTLLLTFALILGNAPVRAQQTPPITPMPTELPAQDCQVILDSSIPTNGPVSLLQLSPDGTQLLLRVAHGLDVSNVDGTNQQLLVRIMPSSVMSDNYRMDTTPNVVSVAWSPNGQYLAYTTVQSLPPAPPQHFSKLYVIYASGPNADDVVIEKYMPIPESIDREVPANPPYSMSWSPDSRYFLFLLIGAGQIDLNIINVNDASQAVLAHNVGLALWLAQEDKIAYVAADKPGSLQIIDLNGNLLNTLSFNLDQIARWQWSPDSTQIVFSGRQANRSGIFVAHADGSDLRYLVPGDKPLWSPDGKGIAFINSTPIQQGLYVINVDGSNQHLLSRVADNFGWTADSQRVIFGKDTPITNTIFSVGIDGFCSSAD